MGFEIQILLLALFSVLTGICLGWIISEEWHNYHLRKDAEKLYIENVNPDTGLMNLKTPPEIWKRPFSNNP